MEFVFNELSLLPLAKSKSEGIERLRLLGFVFRECKKEGATVVRVGDRYDKVELAKNYTLSDFLQDTSQRNHTLKSLMFSALRPDYFKEADEQEAFGEYCLLQVTDTVGRHCHGFAVGYVLNKPLIGFASEKTWDNLFHSITIKKEGHKTVKAEHACVSKVEHATCPDFKNFFDSCMPLELVKSSVAPQDKKSTFSGGHHGQKELKALAKKLNYNPYVKHPITSVDFCPRATDPIERCYENGQVVVVDTSSSAGYALLVQTTGRSMRETEEIANSIREML